MTTRASVPHDTDPSASVTPWQSARFVIPSIAIPLITFLAMLLWQGDAREAFRAVQLCFGWVLVLQVMAVISRVFERGWFEFFAYMMHFVSIGAASLTVTFRLEQYPQDMLYDQMAVLGMSGQLIIGFMALNSRPLLVKARLNPQVLAICAVVVCSAALIKFGFYIRYVGLGGHLEIYTQGDAVRDNSPAVIRILAAGSPLIAFLVITQPGLPRWCRALGVLAVMLEFAIGIRGRPIYIILAVLVLVQDRLRLTLPRKVFIVFGALISVIAVAAIGYFREANDSTIIDFFWMILESLFGIFEAGVFGTQIPDTAPLITGQIAPLLVPTPLGTVDTIAKLLSSTFTPKAYVLGYGYSSSALTEITMLVGVVFSGLAYPIAVLLILSGIKATIAARQTWTFLYGACVLPIAFYIWRAELWQLAVPAIKAAPFILVLLGADAFARLANRSDAARRPKRLRSNIT